MVFMYTCEYDYYTVSDMNVTVAKFTEKSICQIARKVLFRILNVEKMTKTSYIINFTIFNIEK